MEELIPALIFVLIVLAQGIATMLRKNNEEDQTKDDSGEVVTSEWKPRKASSQRYPKTYEPEPEWRAPQKSQPRQAQSDIPKYGAPVPVNKPAKSESVWEKMAREFMDVDDVFVEEEPKPTAQSRTKPQAKQKAPQPKAQPAAVQKKPAYQKPKKPVTQYTEKEAARTILRAYPPAFVNLMKQADRYPIRTGIIFSEIMKRPRAAKKFPRMVK